MQHDDQIKELTADLIDGDIRRAQTLPGWVYRSREVHDLTIERVFSRTWLWLGDDRLLPDAGHASPRTLLPGCLDEPLLLTRDSDHHLHCLSNVCTHRGALICDKAAPSTSLRCPYHGRRFGLDGKFSSMPGFETAAGFPSTRDDLTQLEIGKWHQFHFTSLDPVHPFADLVREMEEFVGFLPIDNALLDHSRSREYLIEANWALYNDNYLEGLHVPFVHPGLSQALDLAAYRTMLFPWVTLQLGLAAPGTSTFVFPTGHPDHGQMVAAYYFWLFPNTMINVYPWGLSVNLVEPLGHDRTRVQFLSYVWDESKLDDGAGTDLHTVEMEDEMVVESVQKGISSRLYHRGRYSPEHELGVHHFHRLLVGLLAQEKGRPEGRPRSR